MPTYMTNDVGITNFVSLWWLHPASKQLNGSKRAKQVKIHATSLRSVAVLGIVVLMKLEYSEGT